MSSSSTTTTTTKKAPVSPTRRDQINHDDFNLKEWGGLKSRLVSRDNTGSRRYSASYIRTIREIDAARSFRSNLTVSSTTVSSPANNYLTDEIDPSTYSFSTALRALQARSSNCWELQSPEIGLTLNPKWNEAEKYICNPFSGEVPMECLSAKTLGNASFRHLTGRITMSAPLVYSKPSYYHNNNNKPKDHELLFPVQEKTTEARTKDVGTQSSEPNLSYSSSSNSSPAPANSTPSIKYRPVKLQVEGESPTSSITTRSTSEEKLEAKERREEKNEEEETERRSIENDEDEKKKEKKQKKGGKRMGKQAGECICFRGGCSLWMMLMMRQHDHGSKGGGERDSRKKNACVHPPPPPPYS